MDLPFEFQLAVGTLTVMYKPYNILTRIQEYLSVPQYFFANRYAQPSRTLVKNTVCFTTTFYLPNTLRYMKIQDYMNSILCNNIISRLDKKNSYSFRYSNVIKNNYVSQ